MLLEEALEVSVQLGVEGLSNARQLLHVLCLLLSNLTMSFGTRCHLKTICPSMLRVLVEEPAMDLVVVPSCGWANHRLTLYPSFELPCAKLTVQNAVLLTGKLYRRRKGWTKALPV